MIMSFCFPPSASWIYCSYRNSMKMKRDTDKSFLQLYIFLQRNINMYIVLENAFLLFVGCMYYCTWLATITYHHLLFNQNMKRPHFNQVFCLFICQVFWFCFIVFFSCFFSVIICTSNWVLNVIGSPRYRSFLDIWFEFNKKKMFVFKIILVSFNTKH